VCGKPQVRCGECPSQAFVPVGDGVIREHLQGRVVAGVYPLLADDTCWFCAIDLDGAAWRDDVQAPRVVFANPVFYERQRLRLSTGRVPRVIACAEEHLEHVALPRGCLDDLQVLLHEHGIELVLDDRRQRGAQMETRFLGTLSLEQQVAVDALCSYETGVLVAPPGAGKTVIAASMIARRGSATLVPTRALVEQWRARLAAFLDLTATEIGVIGGGKRKPTGAIDIATVQSLVRRDTIDEIVEAYGHIVVDECHHVPSVSTERLLRAAPARYILGLTATPSRRDGHQPIIRMQCGPTRHTLRTRTNLALRVVQRRTQTNADPAVVAAGIQGVYRVLATDERRNAAIVGDALAALQEGRSPLILTARRDHLERLVALLSPRVERLCVLHGGIQPAARRAALETLADESAPTLILATGRYLGEGFDLPRLDTLLLALPIAWSGTLTQYAGRLHRPADGKRDARIYDYIDTAIPVLERMHRKRERVYRTLGYESTG